MDNFLDGYQITKLNQDQLGHLNSPITPKVIEGLIESLPTKKSKGPDRFSAELENIILSEVNQSQRIHMKCNH